MTEPPALLVIDTIGATCAALLRVQGEGRDHVRSEELGRGHDQRLAPLVGDLLTEAGVKPQGLTRVGVCVGPGGFTGVRVGVSFVRGLALALGVPAVGVPVFDVWARAAAIDGAPWLAAVHDARRGEIAWRLYRDGAPVGPSATQPSVEVDAAITLAVSGEPVILAGTAAEMLAGPGRTDAGVSGVSLPCLADLADELDPAAAPAVPHYHRPPDAALPGGIIPGAETEKAGEPP